MTTGSSRNAFLVVAALSVAAVVAWNHLQRESSSKDRNSKFNDCGSVGRQTGVTSSSEQHQQQHHRMPPHMERAIAKEKRRLKMIPKLAMKKPMYDNIAMQDPGGHALANISKKKAEWYISKGLASWVEEEVPPMSTIRLHFYPKNRTGQQVYNTSTKQNRCVGCGAEKDYRRHYVVPYSYRARFPQSFKTHLPHDVVILCPTCHIPAEQAVHARMKELEEKARTDPNTGIPATVDRRLHEVRSAALALLRWKCKLPVERIESYAILLRQWYELGVDDELSEDLLQQAADLETRIPNPSYIPGPELVVDQLLLSSDPETVLTKFVQDWRSHFVRTVRPRHLPIGWSTGAPVQSSGPSWSSDRGRE